MKNVEWLLFIYFSFDRNLLQWLSLISKVWSFCCLFCIQYSSENNRELRHHVPKFMQKQSQREISTYSRTLNNEI